MNNDDIPRLPRKSRPADDPKMIGLWKIGRTIGKGSSGRVRIARHSKTGQYAAVKIVSKVPQNSRLSLQNLAERMGQSQLALEREIVVMKLIDHPNIMKLYDVWETSTELYLILEYVQGGELFDYLCNKGRLPTLEALDYFQQIIGAVDYCHRLNIAHRDLKPENILLDQDNIIKIADFGMAAWQANSANNGLLQTSCGSPHYVAPEICSGKAYNGSAADIWSCGIILFALLVGKLPFDAEEIEPLLDKVKLGKFRMPADIDPLAQNLIYRMLKTNVNLRITMAEILDHPFFKLKQPRIAGYSLPCLDTMLHTIPKVSTIDPDIFANLRTLWHGTPDEEIIESLTNPEQNWQKGIYGLLVQYRSKHLENYDEEEEVIARHKRKKAKKSKAVAMPQDEQVKASQSQESYLRPSPSSLPPRDGPPTPNRANRKAKNIPDLSESFVPEQVAMAPPATPLRNVSPLPLSPIWDALNLPPLTAPELQDEKIQEFFHLIADRLNTMQQAGLPSPDCQLVTSGNCDADLLNPVTPNLGPSASPDSHGLGLSGTRPLIIQQKAKPQRPTIDTRFSDKENVTQSNLATGHATCSISKRFSANKSSGSRNVAERRVQIIEPRIPEQLKSRKRSPMLVSPAFSDASSSSTILSPTSSASSSPKRSWIGNLFKFKPANYTLLSIHDVHITRNECRRLLMAMEVKVILEDPEGPGVLKCKLDEVRDPTGLISSKAVKFRVEVQWYRGPEPGYEVALIIIQEKGSMESFKEIYKRLRREWTLDVEHSEPPRQVLPTSPASLVFMM